VNKYGSGSSRELYDRYKTYEDSQQGDESYRTKMKAIICFIMYLSHATDLAKPIIDNIQNTGFDSYKLRELSNISSPENIGQPAYVQLLNEPSLSGIRISIYAGWFLPKLDGIDSKITNIIPFASSSSGIQGYKHVS
jgi:hypothetical protein